MKYHLMQALVVQSDTLNYGLPVGATAHVILVDFRNFNGLPYLIRVPCEQKEYWVPECDLTPADEWIAKESDNVIHDALIDFALATRNKALFDAQARQGVKRE